MSEVSDRSKVTVILADYAATDAVQKVNIIGAGWQVTGIQPQTGATAPQTLVVVVESPPDCYGESFSFSVALLNDADEAVQLPDPAGQPVPLRIAQVLTVEEPLFPGSGVPRRVVPSRSQVVVNFPGGLLLQPGRGYKWQVQIDGNSDPKWSAAFYVPGPPPPPVIG